MLNLIYYTQKKWSWKVFELDGQLLKEKIKKLCTPKVLVIGDLAIDEMVYGDTERISREAPVLILAHSYTKIILGGASNAANNLAALNGGKVSVIGTYGDDYYGPILLQALKLSKINTEYMVKDKTRETTVKTRISGSCSQSVTQQIVRIDRQTVGALSKSTEDKVISNIEKAIPKHDAVILSDYHLGFLTPKIIEKAIETAKKHGKIIVVDAQRDLERYKGATALTPNQPDCEKFLGYFITDDTTLNKAGKDILDKTGAEIILITRGEHGMAVFERGVESIKVPAFNKTKVFDVTGAGDTVVASFTLALAAGISPKYSTIIGNLAASIVIRTFGCATTSIDEMLESVDKINFKDETGVKK